MHRRATRYGKKRPERLEAMQKYSPRHGDAENARFLEIGGSRGGNLVSWRKDQLSALHFVGIDASRARSRRAGNRRPGGPQRTCVSPMSTYSTLAGLSANSITSSRHGVFSGATEAACTEQDVRDSASTIAPTASSEISDNNLKGEGTDGG